MIEKIKIFFQKTLSLLFFNSVRKENLERQLNFEREERLKAERLYMELYLKHKKILKELDKKAKK